MEEKEKVEEMKGLKKKLLGTSNSGKEGKTAEILLEIK